MTGQQSLQTVLASSGQTQANFCRKGKLADESDLNKVKKACCDVTRKEIFVQICQSKSSNGEQPHFCAGELIIGQFLNPYKSPQWKLQK